MSGSCDELLEMDAKSRLKRLLFDEEGHSEFLDCQLDLVHTPKMTSHSRQLAASQAGALSAQTGAGGSEGTDLRACSIKDKKSFLAWGMKADFTSLHICHGCDEPCDVILGQWPLPPSLKVILLGNAGTGKSWCQMCVLRRLLRHQEEHTGDIDEEITSFPVHALCPCAKSASPSARRAMQPIFAFGHGR